MEDRTASREDREVAAETMKSFDWKGKGVSAEERRAGVVVVGDPGGENGEKVESRGDKLVEGWR